MADVVLSAKLSDSELLKSINDTLKTAEVRFNDFTNKVNTQLNGIGKGMGVSLNQQIDSIESRLALLGNKVGNVGGKSSITLNVDNLQSANQQIKSIADNLERAALASGKINKSFSTSNVNDAKRETNEQKVSLELSKQALLLERQNRLKADLAILTQRNAAVEAKSRVATGGQSFEGAMAMSTKSIQERTEKIKALQIVQKNLSTSDANYYSKLASVNKEMASLSAQNKQAISQGVELVKKNNALAQSFENLGRRVLFYTSLGALTGFVKQIYSIRGEYEMLERSMGALLGDFAKGSALFNQIQTQALKSPFTVLDLSSAAKQLVAYNFAANEVAETTKRIADISSALGVPIERLIYNIGQIKAQGALTARDARDFANAGFAIVPMLAKLYTEQKKLGDNVVTTADVYDMMTKKMVSYADVMSVIDKQTSEDGMFFDFQAKQAETLRGQLSNLEDAWNMMLNQIGESNQSTLTAPISLTRDLLKNWKAIANTIETLVIAYGAYKAATLARNVLIGQENAYLAKSAALNKAKIVSDLERARISRQLTTEEVAVLANRNKLTIADYTATLASKNLTKSQATMLALMNYKNKTMLAALVRTNSLTAAELRAALSTKGFAMAAQILGLSLKSLALAAWGVMKAFAPFLAISAVIGIFFSMKQKSDDLKESIKDLNAQAQELRKSLSEISVGFNEAISKNNGLVDAKTKLDELAQFVKDTFNIDLRVDTSKLNKEEVIQEFIKLKEETERIISTTNVFSASAATEGVTKYFEDLGNSAQGFYDIVNANRSSITDSLDAYIKKLKDAKAEQSQIDKVEEIRKAFIAPKRADESYATYLENITKSILQVRKYLNEGDIKNLDIFPSIDESFQKYLKDGGDAVIKYQQFLEETSKKINLKNLTALEFQGVINKYKTDNNLSDAARDFIITWTNKKFKLDIPVTPLDSSLADTEKEVRGWVLKLQEWAKKNPVDLRLTFNQGVSETDVAEEALKNYKDAVERLEVLKRKQAVSMASPLDVSLQEKEVADRLKVAKMAGADLSSINKEATKEQSKLAKAISDEISLIDKLSSNFDKLTKAGMSNKDAIKLLGKEYGNTIESINRVLKANGLKELTIDAFAGKDVSQVLELLKTQRSMLPKNAKADAIKTLDVEIEKIQVDAKVFDFTNLNKKLESSLNDIQASFELGLEFQEDDITANVLKNIFKIDENDLITNVNDLIDKTQEAWDEIVAEYNNLNKENPLPSIDLLTTSEKSFKSKTGIGEGDIFNRFKTASSFIQKAVKDDAIKTQKAIEDLTYKLADNSGKILIEEKKLQSIRLKIEQETNEEKKKLLELQYQDAQNGIDKLKEENLKLIPFYQNLFGNISDLGTRKLKAIYEESQKVINSAKEVTDDKGRKRIELSVVGDDGQIKKVTLSLEEYARILEKIGDIGDKIIKANPIQAMIDAFKNGDIEVALKYLASELSKVSDIANEVTTIFKDLGADDATTEVLGDIAISIGGVATASEGVGQIMSGDILGGVTNVIKGTWTAISTWLDNSDKKIQRQIKKSKEVVEDLANAYTLLEHAVEKALGSAEIQAQRALIANKKLQKQELQRQLDLEKSRKAKNRDEERIRSLEQEIKVLDNELSDLSENITTNLLGSSIKDAAENFASTWIDAWRQGEDAMEGLSDSFDDMIDNMIVKSLASTLVANRLTEIYSMVDKFTQKQSEGGEALVANEIKQIQEAAEGIPEGISNDLTALMTALGIGKGSAAKSLSALQQGIQGITEQTAGAIEGYMNNVSGQVFLHSTLLQQIIDNSNVMLGTQSQILLQMQQGYQVQVAIQGILNGWSSNNGRSVRVEMIN